MTPSAIFSWDPWLVVLGSLVLFLGLAVLTRLVAERRIGFTKVGRYVRFTLADVEQFTDAGRVDPIEPWATYRNTHRAS